MVVSFALLPIRNLEVGAEADATQIPVTHWYWSTVVATPHPNNPTQWTGSLGMSACGTGVRPLWRCRLRFRSWSSWFRTSTIFLRRTRNCNTQVHAILAAVDATFSETLPVSFLPFISDRGYDPVGNRGQKCFIKSLLLTPPCGLILSTRNGLNREFLSSLHAEQRNCPMTVIEADRLDVRGESRNTHGTAGVVERNRCSESWHVHVDWSFLVKA